jgi:thiamine kinase-like enzyme
MNPRAKSQRAAPRTGELAGALERELTKHFGRKRRIVQLERRPSDYHSSFRLEELDVLLEDGTRLPMVFKDVSPSAILKGARRAKPVFLRDPEREIHVYREILADERLGTAVCYGALANRKTGRYWLFLEDVRGRELSQVGEVELWQEAARWLRRLHHRSPVRISRGGPAGRRLVEHSADSYRRWMRRALAFARKPGGRYSSRKRHALEWLAARHERVVERLAALPRTFLHGEFYASNILVQEGPNGVRVCPVDWEMAALGPGLLDLAALTSGNWNPRQREAIAMAYREAAVGGLEDPGKGDFLEALDFCQLQLAVQWLGWSANWKPPPGHAHDWLAEGLRLAETLGL